MSEAEDPKKSSKQVAAYITLPFTLAVPPIIGWGVGKWLDDYMGTAPWLMFTLIVLGFAAGFREFYRIVSEFGNKDE